MMFLKNHKTMLAVVAGVGLFALAGCSASADDSGGSSAAQTTQSTQQNGGSGQQAQGEPGGGVSGEIASNANNLLQVQDTSKQTAVSYSDTTTITAEVTGAASDVAVGSCVVASAARPTTTGTDPSGAPSAEPSATPDASAAQETFAAATVIVTAAGSDGTCAGMGGRAMGAGGTAPTGMPNDGTAPSGVAPSGAPTDMPSGAPSGMPGGGNFMRNAAFGKVTAVDGDTVTVEENTQDGTAKTSTFTMATATVTKTEASDASALVVGKCVSARGESDSSGTVAATSLTVSDPGSDGCTSRVVGFAGDRAGRGTGSNTSGSANSSTSGA